MVRRTTRKPKVYRRKKRVYKRTRAKPSIARLALRLLETKKREYRESEVVINSLSGWYANGDCMALIQNDNYSGMEGHLVRGKGISIRGWVKNNATTTQIVRMGICNVLQGSSKQIDFYNGTDVLEGDTGNVNITTATSTQRMTQRFNQDQYRIVKQLNFKLGNNSSTDGSDVRFFKMWIPLKGMPFRYDGSGVRPTKNLYTLFLCNCLGNSDESVGENVELSFTSTYYYVDP